MLPAAFDFAAAETTDEALALLDEHAEDGKILAGGQSLIPLLKLRFASPAFLIDINRIQGLDFCDEREGRLRIGPLFRHKSAERSSLLASRFPLIAEAAPQIADPIIRNRGTLAGSIAHADPAGDWGTVMLALDAEFLIASKRGTKTVHARDFFRGPFTTAIEPNEMLVEIRVPAPRGKVGAAYMKLERKVADFATAGVAVHLEMDDGHVRTAGIGLTAVGPQNIKATAAEEVLKGAVLDDAVITEAAHKAAEAAEPQGDHRGTADYKRNVVRVFTERGLKRARERAQGGN